MEMVRLIGGAARTGKSLLAHRLMIATQTPYLSLDLLRCGLMAGFPQLGIDPDNSSQANAVLLWPAVRGMVQIMFETQVHYSIEGDALLPAQADALCRRYPGEVRACFLGYRTVDRVEKLRQIRQFGSPFNNWIEDQPDEFVLEMVDQMRAFSELLAAECSRLGLRYIETSDDFPAALEQAYAYMTS
jgi:hypothetical protein